MKFRNVILGISFGTFVLIGCGGTTPVDGNDLPTPTGTITQDDTEVIQKELVATKLKPEDMLAALGGGTTALGGTKHLLRSIRSTKSILDTNDGFAGTFQCSISGSYTVTVTSGEAPAGSSGAQEGSVKYTEVYNDCSVNAHITMNGTNEYSLTWKVGSDNSTWSFDYTGTSKNFIFKLDDTHKFTMTSTSWKDSTTRDANSYNNTFSYQYSGTLVNGSETTTFTNISVDETDNNNWTDETHSMTWKISGAVKNDAFGGTIVITTPVAFAENQDDTVGTTSCPHAGKIVVSGATGVVSTEVSSDHKITVKFNDTVVKEYENCTAYDADNS